jgi:FlaA1/EpsC-like NDP-sugar epimerase
MMEENPVAAIENNVLGTENLIRAARKHGVKRFVHITTDKAVNPVSVYGASKYLSEKLVLEEARKMAGQGDAASRDSSFMVVRFGNVLGSRGSIVPLFQQQIEKGGPVTVTHPDMRRGFMTVPEACSLVLKAGGVGENGNLYLLDMGEPIRIRDMAEQMIRFYGFEPEKEIKIEYVGLRPGERLGESLWAPDEIPQETPYNRILKVERNQSRRTADISTLVDNLRPICKFDAARSEWYRNSGLLRELLAEAVPSLLGAEKAAPKDRACGVPETGRQAPRDGASGGGEPFKTPWITHAINWSSRSAFRGQGPSDPPETRVAEPSQGRWKTAAQALAPKRNT